ncbi:PH domain-containing protein [Paenibacillus turpanensis]|uniref:PH domain-containing protein n=1 Tax=Paenibacillus turpanensis TaxID=2689078 RepID=UPI00140A5E9A|nr:PH domain-containing protein [Paenibacillus turpanensis]
MMKRFKRYHPAFIAVELVSAIKSYAGFYLLLFILKAKSEAHWVVWGRGLLLVASTWTVISIVLKWYSTRYHIDGDTLVVREGTFVKKQRTVALSRIDSHKSNATFVHRWFGLVSLTLETSGENEAYKFPVISVEEERRIIAQLERGPEEAVVETLPERTIHFRSTKKDIFKASFTSLSFLAIIPLVSALYSNLSDFFPIDDKAREGLNYLLSHGWMLVLLSVLAIVLAVTIGYIKTSVTYGNFVIGDDEERIYIDRGVGHSASYSLPKHRVQAVTVEQSVLKRLLGIASVKLISAGSGGDSNKEGGSLYPFMPKQEAYRVLQNLLPSYPIEERMMRFPLKVLWLKLLLPYYLTVITFIGLFIFKREWLWITAPVFILSVLARVLDYWLTSYVRRGEIVQVRTGGLWNYTTVTRRSRIQQITVKQTWLQRKFGVATLVIANKSKTPVEIELFGVSDTEAADFYKWYKNSSAPPA